MANFAFVEVLSEFIKGMRKAFFCTNHHSPVNYFSYFFPVGYADIGYSYVITEARWRVDIWVPY